MKSKLTRILFGGALLALLACQAAAEGKINGITTKNVGDGLQVQIKGEDLSAPKIMRVMGGRSFMLEFDASLINDPQWLKVDKGGVHYIQTVWYSTNPPKVRVHLRVDPNTKLDVTPNGDGYSVKIVRDNSVPATQTETGSAPVATNQGSAELETTLRSHEAPATLQKPRVHTQVVSVPIASHAGRAVSLDFVNTDIVQILKVLAMQSGSNIITSQDVKGQLTVSLGNVSVTDALNLITTLSGYKYGKVGNTYVVTSSDKFISTFGPLSGQKADTSESRVVPLYSGEGAHIKAALSHSVNDVQMLLPSEKAVAVAAFSTNNETDPAKNAASNLAAGAAQATAANASDPTKQATKDAYIVIMGSPSRVNEVEKEVKSLDLQMCHVLNIEYPETSNMIRTIYHPKGNSAAALLQAIAPTADKTSSGFHTKLGTVDMYATPTGSVSEQSVVLYGRETEVNRIVENLESIDSLAQTAGDYLVYNVKYLDPRSLREELLVHSPGLSVSIPPSSAANPNIFKNNQITSQATEKLGQTKGENAGMSSNAAGKLEGNVKLAADDGTAQGLNLPYQEAENYAVPMKLVLRGNRDQIQSALAYLDVIDVAPKQVALELRVMELTKEDALRVGLDWSILTGGTVQSLRLNQGLGDTASTPGAVSGKLGFAGGGSLGVLGTLDAIGNKNKTIARPNLLAIDGRESEIFVGDVVRYIESIQSTQNGTTVTTGQVPVGVRLAVMPRIGADDTVLMDLRPTVSSLTGFTPVPGGGNLPQTSLRIAQSTMLMHSGETIALGGLIQDQDRKRRSGIPILKDLPLLGLLFGRTDNDHIRTEIVFFLTAKVVTGNERTNAADPMNKVHNDKVNK